MKNFWMPSMAVALLALTSCNKEVKTTEETVDNTAEVEAIAENANVDSSDVAQYNADQEDMIDNNPGVTLKNAKGEDLKLQFSEEADGNKFLTYTKGNDAPKKVGLLTAHEGKEVYGDDKISVEVSESGNKAVFVGSDKVKVEYK